MTGASSGIGQACAVRLAADGARVVLSGRDVPRLEETLRSLSGVGHVIEPLDLAGDADVSLWMKGIVESVGPLRGLVHSAGLATTLPLRSIQAHHLESLMKVNVTAAVLLAKAFRQKGVCVSPSSIVFVSSVMGVVGEPGRIAYSASKAALIGMTRSMAVELAREGIRVNAVAPGVVRTSMSEAYFASLPEAQQAAVAAKHPLGLGEPEDVADAVAFLLSARSKWVTGTTLVVDGGYSAS